MQKTWVNVLKKEEKQLINIKTLNIENSWVVPDLCLCVIRSRAEVEILEDGTWHINKILGRYEPAYKEKKTYE